MHCAWPGMAPPVLDADDAPLDIRLQASQAYILTILLAVEVQDRLHIQHTGSCAQ